MSSRVDSIRYRSASLRFNFTSKPLDLSSNSACWSLRSRSKVLVIYYSSAIFYFNYFSTSRVNSLIFVSFWSNYFSYVSIYNFRLSWRVMFYSASRTAVMARSYSTTSNFLSSDVSASRLSFSLSYNFYNVSFWLSLFTTAFSSLWFISLNSLASFCTSACSFLSYANSCSTYKSLYFYEAESSLNLRSFYSESKRALSYFWM